MCIRNASRGRGVSGRGGIHILPATSLTNKRLPVTKGKSEAILRKCNCDTQCTAGRSAPQWRMQRCYKEKPQIFLSVVRHLVPEMELEVLSTMMHKWMALGVEDLQ